MVADNHPSTQPLDAGRLSEQNAGLNLNLSHSFKVAAALLAFLVVLQVCAKAEKREFLPGGFIGPEVGKQTYNFLNTKCCEYQALQGWARTDWAFGLAVSHSPGTHMRYAGFYFIWEQPT